MNRKNTFSSTTCQLEGINIIEASAGTGKTYNIEDLYARLVLEKGFSVESILVVTYTEAATKELIARISSMLYELNMYYEGNKTLERVHKLAESISSPELEVKQRLSEAMLNIDNASIYTIHGFCSQILNDYAFESRILFNVNMETNIRLLIDDIVEDFWRKTFYNCEHYINSLAAFNNISPESLADFINQFISKPNVEITPEIPSDAVFSTLSNVYNALLNNWNRNAIENQLNQSNLAQGSYKPEQIAIHCANIELLIRGLLNKNTLEALKKFTKSSLHGKAQKKGSIKPEHQFFDAADTFCDLEESFKEYKTYIRYKCKDYFLSEYEKRKKAYNIQTFDGLLKDVYVEITRKNSSLLVKTKEKYKAALIDEFQDTDSVQYGIFNKIFIEGKKTVFMVGDPKQAIYGFRGGDIFTYQMAKKQQDSSRIKTLNKNWRSSPEMVKAVNALFESEKFKGNPFVSKEIKFERVSYESKNSGLQIDGVPDDQPLKIIPLSGDFTTDRLVNQCSVRTAIEINNLLCSNTALKAKNAKFRKVKPSDITILVSSHKQAAVIQPELRKLNIPSVMQTTGSIFDTREAEMFEVVMKSVSEPGNTKMLKGALLTDLIAFDALFVSNLEEAEDEEKFEGILNNFRKLNQIWEKKTFIEMFNSLVTTFNVYENILSLENGERKLTNFMHIAESLQQKEMQSACGINSLITWFNTQRNPDTRKNEDEFEVRLDTDRNAVSIMTIHKSKGLEFPIVFCPFLWSINAVPYKSQSENLYHNKNDKNIIDIAGNHDAKNLSNDEKLEELLRVFYVAVTRAKYQCYILTGKTSSKNSSALDYIFYGNDSVYKSEKGSISVNLNKVAKDVKENSIIPELSNAQLPYILIDSEDKELPISTNSYNNKEEQSTELHSLQFNEPNIDKSWKVSSYSTLMPHENKKTVSTWETEGKDNDSTDNGKIEGPSESPLPKEKNIFSFQGGAKIGNCWHEIFESLDFTDEDETIYKIVSLKQNIFGLNSNTAESESNNKIAFNMVKNVLNCNLPGAAGLKLSAIDSQSKISEMEFYFSISGLDTEKVEKLLLNYCSKFSNNVKPSKMQNSTINGYMKGYIDLVFKHDRKYYILDWKSNIIKRNPNNFNVDGLTKEMSSHYYFLQYLIYTVALDKFLKSRIKNYSFDKHFGGVYYIFLRGVENNPNSSRGIYFDRPDKQTVKHLAKIMSGGSK